MLINSKVDVKLSEMLRANGRALGILWHVCPKFFIASGAQAVVTGIIPYVTVFLSAKIITELSLGRRLEVLLPLIALSVGIVGVLSLLKAFFEHWNSKEIDVTFPYKKDRIYTDKMISMDFSSIDDAKTHALRSDIKQSENWNGWNFIKIAQCYHGMLKSISGILSAVILTITLFTTVVPETNLQYQWMNNSLLTVAFIGVLIFLTWLAPKFSTKAQSYWNNSSDNVKMGNRVFTFFGYIAIIDRFRAMDIRIYNQQDIFNSYFGNFHGYDTKSEIAKAFRGPGGVYEVLAAVTSIILTGLSYAYVCMKAWLGTFGVGYVMQYVGALTAFFNGVSELLETFGTLKANTTFLRTTFEFLDINNEMYQGSLTTEKRSDRNYEVEFKDVSFCYPNTKIYTLKHVNMKFKIGSRLAVVGMNGSGKTTFIKLLCRLYDPTEGEILLNGINIRKYSYNDYIKLFSVVFQDFQLLAFPLGQNVAASATYNKGRVEECLEKAGFQEKLQEMTKGVDTCLYRDFEEDGVEISGGEAQKIAIARALYKDAPFIILDEPTAALDPLAEADIYSRFSEIATDRTTVYISHRLSSCRFCDEILVFDQGQVVQQGTHEELVKQENMKYYELWNSQAQYYRK